MGAGWTPEEDALAARLWDQGYSASEIGARIGKFRSAVIGRLSRSGRALKRIAGHRSGVPTRIWSDADLLDLWRMIEPAPGEEVWSEEEIAERFRVSVNEIKRLVALMRAELAESEAA